MRKPVMLMAPYSITSLSHRSSIIWLQRNIRVLVYEGNARGEMHKAILVCLHWQRLPVL